MNNPALQTPSSLAPTSTLAIVALIFSIICPPLGLILGIIALVRISDSRGTIGGKGLAIASLVVSGLMLFVVMVLAAIAIPGFMKYQQRAKGSEAKVTLSALRNAEESYRAENDVYLRASANPAGLPSKEKSPWEDRPCSSLCNPKTPSACAEFSCLGYVAQGPVYYRYACETRPGDAENQPDFTCVAVGDLDGDGEFGVFVYGSANGGGSTIGAPVPALAGGACKGNIPAKEVHDCRPGEY